MLFCTCLKILGILEFRTFRKSTNLFNSLALKPETETRNPLHFEGKNVRLQFPAWELQYSIHFYLKAESWSPLPGSAKHRIPASPIVGFKLPVHHLGASGFGALHFVYQGGPLPTRLNTAKLHAGYILTHKGCVLQPLSMHCRSYSETTKEAEEQSDRKSTSTSCASSSFSRLDWKSDLHGAGHFGTQKLVQMSSSWKQRWKACITTSRLSSSSSFRDASNATLWG